MCLCVCVRLCAAYHLLVLYKDRTGRFGMGVASVNGSILVNYVQPSSPAELAGLKFGDEIASVSVVLWSHTGALHLMAACWTGPIMCRQQTN